MKKLSGLLLIGLAIAFLLPACKYEEGPKISLRSKKARVVNQWKVEKISQNGYDITITYQASLPDLVCDFKDDGTVINSWTQGGQTVNDSETWEFTSDKAGLNITSGGIATTWDILRLKNDEMWLKRTFPTGLSTTVEEIHYVTK
jgi:hypothetical protein